MINIIGNIMLFLFGIFAILALILLILGVLYLIKVFIEEWLEIDFNDIVKIRRINDEDSSVRTNSSKDS